MAELPGNVSNKEAARARQKLARLPAPAESALRAQGASHSRATQLPTPGLATPSLPSLQAEQDPAMWVEVG